MYYLKINIRENGNLGVKCVRTLEIKGKLVDT